jgi:hypothetical protein
MALAIHNQAMEHIYPLPRPTPARPKPSKPIIQAGLRYDIDLANLPDTRLGNLEDDLQNGLLGDYRLSPEQSAATAVDIQRAQAFVWDSELLGTQLINSLLTPADHPQLVNCNRLTLLEASIAAPAVTLAEETPMLSISPHFELEWDTAGFCSQLGVLQLLESTRAAHFTDGETMTLLDTLTFGGSPVLYIGTALDNLAVTVLGAFQQQGHQQKRVFSHAVTQTIPSQIAGKAVASVSVLEKYTVYFMQNAGPDRPDLYIWAPAHLPIVWGWSIRVQQRYDGVWDIFRKKLIMPSASTEAPRLPLWHSNSLLCQTT